MALLPYLSKVFGVGGNTALGRGVGWSARFITLVFAPILVGLALIAKPFFIIIFGPEFAGSIPLFLVLLSFALVSFLASPFILGLQALGKTKDIFVIQAAASWTCLGATILLSRFGIMGVTVGGEMLGLVTSLLSVYAFRQRIAAPMDVEAISMARTLLPALAMVPPVYIVSLVLPQYRFVPLQVLVGVVMYLLVVRWLRLLSREDLSTMSMMLPPRVGRFLMKIFGYE
jgi:O-antigen/teichoic acid export membrane protein